MTVRCPAKAVENEWEGKTNGRFSCVVPSEHSLDAVKSPHYFAQVSNVDLRVHDEIAVRPEDASWYVLLLIRGKLLDQVNTRPLHEVVFDDELDFPAGWSADFRSRETLFVLRKGDTDVESGFQTEDAALVRAKYLAAQEKPKKPAPKRAAPKQAAKTKEDA